MTRTFIALELSEYLQTFLSRLIQDLARELPNLRWVDPAGIHLTLAFLGELSEEQLNNAVEATTVAASQLTPFAYSLSRLGIFGTPRQPRVVWMGIEESSGQLRKTHHILSQELAGRDFVLETRSFSPHFTLARVKDALSTEEQGRLQRILSSARFYAPPTRYQVDELSVMKSSLSSQGAHYTCLKSCPFRSQEET